MKKKIKTIIALSLCLITIAGFILYALREDIATIFEWGQSPGIQSGSSENIQKPEEIIETKEWTYYSDFIMHNGELYTIQMGVFIKDKELIGEKLGEVTALLSRTKNNKYAMVEGHANGYSIGTEYFSCKNNDNIIFVKDDYSLAGYWTLAKNNMKYSNLNEVVKDKESIVDSYFYKNYFNTNKEDIVETNMDNLFESMEEAEFFEYTGNKSWTTSMIFFDFGDSFSYAFRIYYSVYLEKVVIVNELYKQQFILSDKNIESFK